MTTPPPFNKVGVTVLFNHLDGSTGPRALKFPQVHRWEKSHEGLRLYQSGNEALDVLVAEFNVGVYAGVFYNDARAPDTTPQPPTN